MAEKKSTNPVDSVTIQQAGISFNTIAQLADTARSLCVEAIDSMSSDDEQASRMAVAARELCSQIGLIADVGAKSLGESPLKGVDPSKWLQPPVYHWAADKVEGATHG